MKRVLLFVLTICLIISVSAAALAESAEVSLFQYRYSGGATGAEMDVSMGGKKDGYLPTEQLEGINALIFASVSGVDGRKLEWSQDLYETADGEDYVPVMTGGSKNPWGSQPYFLLTFTTTGYSDITFSARIGGTNKGPREYKLQYSLDGEEYTDIANTAYTITNNKEMQLAFDHVQIEAITNAEQVYLKIIACSELCIDNGDLLFTNMTSGETAINDILVTGVPISDDGNQTGEVLLGDLDHDQKVSVSDVISLRGCILSGNPSSYQLSAGDFDQNKILTVSDVIALRSRIMQGH